MPDFQSGITNLFNLIGFAATQDPVKKLQVEQEHQITQGHELLNQRLNQFYAVQQYKKQLENNQDPEMIEPVRDIYRNKLAKLEENAWENVKAQTGKLVDLNDPTAIQNQLMFGLLGDSEARGLVAKLQAENKLMQNGTIRQFRFNDVNLNNAASHEYWGAELKDKQAAVNEAMKAEVATKKSALKDEANLKKKSDAFAEKYGNTIRSSEAIQKAEDELIRANAAIANKQNLAKKETQKAEEEFEGTRKIFNDIDPIWNDKKSGGNK